MNEQLISVGITVWRRPEMLLQSAGSVLGQTYKNLELMIGINPEDEEADALLRCAQSLMRMDRRVRIVFCPGCRNGFEKARRLIAEARGPWMAAIDYDDLWAPNRLEAQIPLTAEYDVIGAMAIYFGQKWGQLIPVPSGPLGRADFQTINPMISPTVLMRTMDARDYLDPDYSDGPHDYKMWIDLMQAGRRFYNLPEVLALHRLSIDSYYNANMDQTVVDRIRRMA